MEVVYAPTIYMRDPFLRLKGKKGPATDPKEGQKERGPSQVAEAEEVEEEEETLLSWRERSAASPSKRKQFDPGSTPASKPQVHIQSLLLLLLRLCQIVLSLCRRLMSRALLTRRLAFFS